MLSTREVPLATLRRQLRDGEARFPVSRFPLSACWFPSGPVLLEDPSWPESPDPDGAEPDGLLQARAEVVREFWEEVELLAAWLATAEAAQPQPGPPGSTGGQLEEPEDDAAYDPEETEAVISLNRRAAAFDLWEIHALPLRVKNGHVFRVSPPPDIQSSIPRVLTMPFSDFAVALAEKSALVALERDRLRKRLGRWRAVGVMIPGCLLLWVGLGIVMTLLGLL